MDTLFKIKPYKTAASIRRFYIFYSTALYFFAAFFIIAAIFFSEQFHYKMPVAAAWIFMKAVSVFVYRYYYDSLYFLKSDEGKLFFSHKKEELIIDKNDISSVKKHNNYYVLHMKCGRKYRVLKEINKLQTVSVNSIEQM